MLAYLRTAIQQYPNIEEPVTITQMLYETEEAYVYSSELDKSFCVRLDNLIIIE